jgi:toxin ParE1/3/4
MISERSHLLWSPQAEGDLAEIWRWGAKLFSPAAADRHLRNIHAAAERCRLAPFLGRERDDLRPDVREIVVYPTVVFYRVTSEAVEIIRVIDGRRNLAALFGPR